MLARVTLVIDDASLRRTLSRELERVGDVLVHSFNGKSLFNAIRGEICDMLIVSASRIPKPWLESVRAICGTPDAPAVVILESGEDEEDRAALMACGCEAVLSPDLQTDALVEALATLLARRMGQALEVIRERRSVGKPSLSDFISHSPSMRTFMKVAQRVVRSDSSLLILGETGVGKERLALAIHSEGHRVNAPFIPINCAALPETLLESELFGHEQGAFTGATKARRGAFEMAHRGTIFLDEIGDMPLALQAKLLRVLQDRRFMKLGGEKAIHVDVRIMAATNRDIVEEVAAGRFRRDLYYRLSVVTLLIPPLRERREDIPELVRSYLNYLAPRIGVDISDITAEAMRALCTYDWPGNVRELINVLERAMLLSEEDAISPVDLPDEISLDDATDADGFAPAHILPAHWREQPWKAVRREALDRCEHAYIEAQLAASEGRVGDAAARAGMSARAFYEKMQRHGVRKERFKGD